MKEEFEIIPEIRILAKGPGDSRWSVYEDPDDHELQRALIECEIAAYKILKRHFRESQANRNKSEEKQ